MRLSSAPNWSTLMQSIRSSRLVAAALVTVLTLVLIGVVLLATTPIGCGPANAIGLKTITSRCAKPLASASPSPTSSPSPSSSPTAVFSPSPFPTNAVPPDSGPATGAYPPFHPAATGSGGVAIPGLNLDCRLPVYAGLAGSGGFIVFPGGAFVADPKSAVSLPSPSPGKPTPSPNAGYGQPAGLSYDIAFSRWVPVASSQVTPDGRRYAFASADSVYVVDVPSGTLSEIGQGQAWNIVSVQAAGVYATQPNKAGLWLLPFSGALRQITAGGFWQVANADAAYGTPTSAVPQGATNVIVRVDLNSGATSNWFTRKNSLSAAVGIDSHGAAIISVIYFAEGGGSEVWIATGAGTGTPITGSGNGLSLGGSPVADSYGVWFVGTYTPNGNYYGAKSGFALYVPGQGMYWMSNFSALLAGGCVQP